MDSIWVPPPPPPPPPTAVPFTQEAINHAPDSNIPINSPAPANHPPYAEMIYRAIEALKEKDGSSKTAIAKYIEEAYTDLPPAHSTLLTHHLKRLKDTGLLIMLKKSYKLPSSLPSDITQNAAQPVRRGRPPRSGIPKRRGRPPKPKSLSNGLKRRPGRPPKHQLQATVIPFADPSLAQPPVPVGSPRPRGRPRKNAAALPPSHAVGGVDSSLMVPGRPQKLAVRGRPKNPAGRPVGRPKVCYFLLICLCMLLSSKL